MGVPKQFVQNCVMSDMDDPYLFLWGVKLCQGTTSPQFNKTLRRKEFAKNYDFMIDPSQRCLPQMGLCQNKRKTIWPKKGVAKIHPFFERTYSEMIYGLFANCETKHLFIHFIRPFMNIILFSDLFSPQVNKTKPRYYLTKRKKYIVSRVVTNHLHMCLLQCSAFSKKLPWLSSLGINEGIYLKMHYTVVNAWVYIVLYWI